MSSHESAAAPMCASATDDPAGFVAHLRQKGVSLWLDQGRLRYRTLRGALTEEEVRVLKSSAPRIMTLLASSADPERENGLPRTVHHRSSAPLTFSQLEHWQSNELSERSAVRQLASALRLLGRLDVAVLANSLDRIVRRHDALRTRIVLVDGIPQQKISEDNGCELRVHDLSILSQSAREAHLTELIDQLILEPIDVSVGPLLGVDVARLGSDEHVVMVAMEHSISDAVSLQLFIEELLTCYQGLSQGLEPSLPAVGVQYSSYAHWVRETHERWSHQHGAYWRDHLKGCGRLRFPSQLGARNQFGRGWAGVSITVEGEFRTQLRHWCRSRGTTPAMAAFTAYAALVLRWCDARDGVIRYQTDGRLNATVQNAIGYFATVLHLRMSLHENDTFLDLLKRATDEYCSAYEHADYSYLDAYRPRLEFALNATFNWIPQDRAVGMPQLTGSGLISSEAIPFANPALRSASQDREPIVMLYDTASAIVGGVYFPRQRFEIHTMQKFANNLVSFLKTMVHAPETRLSQIGLQ
jgi:hypothetical protein